MNSSPENQNLLELIKKAQTGKIVLPQFQRNFVWARDDINDLLVSILQDHFIGSFLFLNTDKDNIPFKVRSLEGVEITPSHLKPDHMVLDGQQRLTSLNYAFTAPNIPVRYSKYPFRFYLDLSKLTEGNIENAVWNDYAYRAGKRLERIFQFENKLIPFTELLQFDQWKNAYEKWLAEKDRNAYFTDYFEKDKEQWDALNLRLRTFDVPVISLPKVESGDGEALAEVCAIFEKMNSTGVKLSVYDLLTARMYIHNIDIHELWQQTVAEYPYINEHSDGVPDTFGVYLLRIMALIRGSEVRSKNLINLTPHNFTQDWKIAVDYMEKALTRMRSVGEDGFGAFNIKWIPYSTMVSPLAAMLHTIEKKNLDHKAYKIMQSWYWSAVFRERYGGSVETNIYKDFQDFLRALKDDGFEPEAISDARTGIVENPAFTLRDVNRVNSVYRGIMSLVALHGAKDFIADDAIHFHDLEDHHIFPKAYLKKHKIKDNLINCILNRTLISDVSNGKISSHAPSKYVPTIIPTDRRDEILRSHFIDESAARELVQDNFDAFLDKREKAFLQAVKQRIMWQGS